MNPNNIDIIVNNGIIDQSLARLDSLNKPDYRKGTSIDGFIRECDSILRTSFSNDALVFLHTTYKPTYKIYRVRPFLEINDFESINEYSFPPKKLCKLQRANLPYNPVFYCSLHPYTALNEYIKNNSIEQVKFCVSVWSFKANMPDLKVLPIFKENVTDYVLKEQIELLFKDKPNDFRAAITKYINHIGDIFLKKIEKPEDYSFSAYLGTKFLYNKYSHGDTVDVLIFPSIASLQETNFAIHPDIVSSYLNLDYVYIIEFLNKKIISTTFDILIFKDNKFETRIDNINLKDTENKYTKMFIEDFKLVIEN